MGEIIGRDYCLKHPGQIIKLFGLGVFLGMLFCGKKTLLQRVTENYRSRGFPMPGHVGNAYRIAAMIEFRVSRVYARLAERFQGQGPVRDFFRELQEEELEHGRLMLLCLYTVGIKPSLQFIPSVRDPKVREITHWLRGIKRTVDDLTLEEALRLTEEIEAGEVNIIFDKLLKQTEEAESRLFQEEMRLLEGHATAVPQKIAELRRTLAGSESIQPSPS